MRDVVNQCPADSSSASGIDESVLRTGVEGVFAVYKFGMKHDVTLLALRFQVGQAFPCLQVFGAGDACSGCSRREVACRSIVVMAFGTKYAVYPTVFVGGEAHVVDVGGGDDVIGHRYGVVPKAEVVYPVGAFRYGEERLAVGTFHAGYEQVFAVPFNRSRVKHGVHSDAFHQVGIGAFVEVVPPENGRVGCCQNDVCTRRCFRLRVRFCG